MIQENLFNILIEQLKIKFYEKIIKKDGCWGYKGKIKYGYPHISTSFNGICLSIPASRLSWIIHKGLIPDKMLVLHNCPNGDNTFCSNPDHLFLGDQRINMKDKIQKGRYISSYKSCCCNDNKHSDGFCIERKYKNGEKELIKVLK